jgi:hypothetical protein
MQKDFRSKEYLKAVAYSVLLFVTVPGLMAFCTLLVPLPSWLVTAGCSAVLLIAFIIARTPVKLLLGHGSEFFKETIGTQALIVAGAVLYWALFCLAARFLPEPQPFYLFAVCLIMALLGIAWVSVSSVLLLFNLAGFILAVGRKLNRLSRCTWYVLLILLPLSTGMWHLAESGKATKAAFAVPVVALFLAVWLGIHDFSRHPTISSPTRYDPVARWVAKLFGGA